MPQVAKGDREPPGRERGAAWAVLSRPEVKIVLAHYNEVSGPDRRCIFTRSIVRYIVLQKENMVRLDHNQMGKAVEGALRGTVRPSEEKKAKARGR